MVEKIIEFLSRQPPFLGGCRLKVDENQAQIKYREKRKVVFIGKSWVFITVITTLVLNVKNVLPSINSKKLIFNSTSIKIMLLILLVLVVMIILWKIFHSKYSPIETWKVENLLRKFTEEADLLRNHDDSFAQTKSVKWIYRIIRQEIHIALMTGGHVNYEMEKDIPRRLQGFLIKETGEKWFLEDKQFKEGRIEIIFSHEEDKRIVIDDLNKLKKSVLVNIQLTERLFWNITKQPMMAVIGKTGSGKTTFIKAIIISFLANNPNNNCCIIDGKNAFLAQSGRFANIPTATTAEETLNLLDDAIIEMEKRYCKINKNQADEVDTTYVEKFPNEGNILIVCDELLALSSATQAQDKLKKPAERLMPQISERILSLIVKSRQANITLVVSGQAFPATLLGDSIAKSNMGALIYLGRPSEIKVQQFFGIGLKDLPQVDTSNYGGLIILDGISDVPKKFISPYYDDEKLPFKKTLKKLSQAEGEAHSLR